MSDLVCYNSVIVSSVTKQDKIRIKKVQRRFMKRQPQLHYLPYCERF